jgi:apolipoprotein N-acyltransferase
LRWGLVAIALIAGLAQAASIAAPWNGQPQWWLQVLSLMALIAALQRIGSWRQGLAVGWVFSTAWLCGTFWWLFISMHTYGGLASPLAAIAVLGLAVFLGSYYAAAAAAFVALRGNGPFMQAVSFAALWLLGELLRATWFTGFPWGAGGYAHIDGPLGFLAPLAGVYGIGFVASLIAFALAFALVRGSLRSWRYWAAVGGAAAVLAACNLAAPRSEAVRDGAAAARPLSVALLQGNIAQDEKFEGGSGIPIALRWYGEQLDASSASLVVTPETAIPLLPTQLPDGYYDSLRRRFSEGSQAAIIGIPLGNSSDGYTNSVQGLAPGQPVYRFDKHHLVPFGEFIPPLFKWFVRMMNIPLGDFNRGSLPQPPLEWAGQRIAPNICYEDLFGEEIGANFRDASRAPTMLVNVSNIAWFGNSIAIDQHLQISRMRAVEFDRPMLRATNTGATVIIDHTGRVTHSLPRHTRGVLLGQAQGRESITPFAWWVSRFGLMPLWLLSMAIVITAAWLARRSR